MNNLPSDPVSRNPCKHTTFLIFLSHILFEVLPNTNIDHEGFGCRTQKLFNTWRSGRHRISWTSLLKFVLFDVRFGGQRACCARQQQGLQNRQGEGGESILRTPNTLFPGLWYSIIGRVVAHVKIYGHSLTSRSKFADTHYFYSPMSICKERFGEGMGEMQLPGLPLPRPRARLDLDSKRPTRPNAQESRPPHTVVGGEDKEKLREWMPKGHIDLRMNVEELAEVVAVGTNLF